MQNLLWDLPLSSKYIISALFFKKLWIKLIGPSFRPSKYIKQCIKEIKFPFMWLRIPVFQTWHVCSRRLTEIKFNMTSRWNEFRTPCSLFTFKLSSEFLFLWKTGVNIFVDYNIDLVSICWVLFYLQHSCAFDLLCWKFQFLKTAPRYRWILKLIHFKIKTHFLSVLITKIHS